MLVFYFTLLYFVIIITHLGVNIKKRSVNIAFLITSYKYNILCEEENIPGKMKKKKSDWRK